MIAASKGQYLILKRLLQEGAELNCQDKLQGETALMKSVISSNFDETYALLQEGADVNIVDTYGQTALDLALYKFDSAPDIVDLLVEAKATQKKKSLHFFSKFKPEFIGPGVGLNPRPRQHLIDRNHF